MRQVGKWEGRQLASKFFVRRTLECRTSGMYSSAPLAIPRRRQVAALQGAFGTIIFKAGITKASLMTVRKFSLTRLEFLL